MSLPIPTINDIFGINLFIIDNNINRADKIRDNTLITTANVDKYMFIYEYLIAYRTDKDKKTT